MRRIMLRVAYDGTEYCGWQRQPNGTTVEEVLTRALCALLKEEIAVIGASRTDAGVHARGNVCVFDTGSRIPGEKFAQALNPYLPGDIAVQESREVAPDFHPRRCNCNKTYEYRIYNAAFPDPLLRRYTHFFYRPLDVAAMRQAAGFLVGEYDFKSFCSVNTQVKETVRRINFLEIEEEEVPGSKVRGAQSGVLESAFSRQDCKDAFRTDSVTDTIEEDAKELKSEGKVEKSKILENNGKTEAGEGPEWKMQKERKMQKNAGLENARIITIRINGNGFLYNMVRIIAGTLIEVGCHWRSPESMVQTLSACDRQAAGATAPACGLTLAGIWYEEALQ